MSTLRSTRQTPRVDLQIAVFVHVVRVFSAKPQATPKLIPARSSGKNFLLHDNPS
jgi:hypothetical protein